MELTSCRQRDFGSLRLRWDEQQRYFLSFPSDGEFSPLRFCSVIPAIGLTGVPAAIDSAAAREDTPNTPRFPQQARAAVERPWAECSSIESSPAPLTLRLLGPLY